MATALVQSARLKPEIRLGQAISQFQADLSSADKATFRSHQTTTMKKPPSISDVMQVTAEINQRGVRCFGTRVTTFLQAVQNFAALGDTVIGGTQNLLACGVWSLVRMTLLAMVNYNAYFERLTSMLMKIGRSAPRYESLALIYPNSKTLQSSMMEYFIVVVQLCHHTLRLSQKPAFKQWTSTLNDSTMDGFQSELELWATSIKEEVTTLMAKELALESQDRTWFKSQIVRHFDSKSQVKELRAKQRILDACSTYDYESAWRAIRKFGNVSLLTGSTYTTWKGHDRGCTLLCTGKLGSGKSVVLANIIDDLNLPGNTTPVAYFFCQHDAEESLTARAVIGSLARQLLHPLIDDLDRASGQVPQNGRMTVDNLISLLKDTLQQGYHAFFILDGLGHCDPGERDAIIHSLHVLQETISLSVCISGRLETSEILKDVSDKLCNVTSLPMPVENPDIHEFVNAELQRCLESRKLVIGDPLLILEIQQGLTSKAQGMFLWVALQIKALCLERTDADIRHALDNLPSSLSEIYNLILIKAGVTNMNHQRRILELVVAACRPLTMEEMREALSVVPGSPVWDPRALPNDVYSTMSCCGGVLTVDEDSSSIQMVHHSVRAFLQSDYRGHGREAFTLDGATQNMAEIVLTYLNYKEFSKQVASLKALKIHTESVKSSVVAAVADSFGHGRSQKLALKLLQRRKMGDIDVGPTLLQYVGQNQGNTVTPLAFHRYADAWWTSHIWHLDLENPSTHDLLGRLLDMVDIDKVDDDGRTSLSHAAERGRTAMVDILLTHGASHTPDSRLMTPLHWAIEADNVRVADSLLGSATVQANLANISGQTPLMLAVSLSRLQTAGTLIKCPLVDVNCRDSNGDTMLMSAIARGCDYVVDLLLSTNRTDLKAVTFQRNTALHIAAKHGLKTRQIDGIIDMLGNSPVIAMNEDDQTPIWIASFHGRRQMVECFIRRTEARIDLLDSDGYSPVWIAAQRGHDQVVDVLTSIWSWRVRDEKDISETQAMITYTSNKVNRSSESPLWIAASKGHEKVVEVLVKVPGINPNLANNDKATPLWVAAAKGHEKVVKVLVDVPGINLNKPNKQGNTPLLIAAARGHNEVIKLLVDVPGIDLNHPNKRGYTPLWIAAAKNHVGVVNILISCPAVVLQSNHKDKLGVTPLAAAVEMGNTEVVDILTAAQPWFSS
ncbi:uncharacterized protein DSM5745_04358 [Aspergillus mulundensis]|uniref:Uncharacterized protein n=1 Tax=Aspergillus mulundensis TaxID=1810919 RepID=A0A3D8SCG2_9EURO|nr:hypothetical protein DSM5745_04358 [Aspergillus mulundensis]RDW84032.1 hypothetical protein DSM5745_04358 [Aspergillus mulundensis]